MEPIDTQTPPQREAKVTRYARQKRLLTGQGLPDLVIELGQTYAFKVEQTAVRLVDDNVVDVSYVSRDLTSLTDFPIVAKLSSKHTVDLPPGVTILLGKSGSGKTHLAFKRIVAENDNATYIRYGEPLDSGFVRAIAAPDSGAMLADFEVQLATWLANILAFDEGAICVVDSLRHLVYAPGGATGKGGVNMTLFSQLSFLDTVVARRGCALVVIVNPMTDDAAAYSQIREVAAGSASAIIDVHDRNKIEFNSRYNGRRWMTMSLPSLDDRADDAPQHSRKVAPGSANLSTLRK